jgi:hypothetical protein
LSLLSFERQGKTGAIFLDANLIWVAPECHDAGGLACLYCGTFGENVKKCELSKAIRECVRGKDVRD